MSAQKGLTDEQKQRIAENRQRALAKLAKKTSENSAQNSSGHLLKKDHPYSGSNEGTHTRTVGLKSLSTGNTCRPLSSVCKNSASECNNSTSLGNNTASVIKSAIFVPSNVVPLSNTLLAGKNIYVPSAETCLSLRIGSSSSTGSSIGTGSSSRIGSSIGTGSLSRIGSSIGTGSSFSTGPSSRTGSSSVIGSSLGTGSLSGTGSSTQTGPSSRTGQSSVNSESINIDNKPLLSTNKPTPSLIKSSDCFGISSNFYGKRTEANHAQQKSISSNSFSRSRTSVPQSYASNTHSDRHSVAMRPGSGTNNFTSASHSSGSSEAPFSKKPFLGGIKGSCVLFSRERFHVEVEFHPMMVDVFKTIKSKQYDAVNKRWSFKLEDHEELMMKLRPLRPQVDISGLPAVVKSVFKQQFSGKYPPPRVPEADLSGVDPVLSEALLPFQKTGVSFGISRKGRVLIADDMGLGKTIQAICLACYYRHEWPLVVVVPSSVRYDWAEQIRRWVPSLEPQKINVIQKFKDSSSASVVIVSYTLMVRKLEEFKKRNFEVIIMDECHLLKDIKSSRTKAALSLLQKAKRVILLSGTPCLSRPSELYTQIIAISPCFFKFHDFGLRYCEGKQTCWGWDFNGCSNLGELQLLLEEKFLIRRLKTDVLSQLPPKQRKMVLLDPSSINLSEHLKEAASSSGKKVNYNRRKELLKYFHETATAKVGAVKNYVLELLESGHKFLVFAHHQELLDAIETAIENKTSYSYIRIDGKTSPERRKTNCDRFQTSESVRVALLSIMAANAGINLTAASLVVFAELFWNPGILVQAEDRVHRIGQKDSVNVHYLVAPGTADDHIWPLVQRKLDVLSKTGLSKEDFSDADTCRQTRRGQQKGIKEFLEESFFDDGAMITQAVGEQLDNEETKGNKRANVSPKKRAEKSPRKATTKSPSKSPIKQTGIQQFFKPTTPDKAENSSTAKNLSTAHQSEFDDEFDKSYEWLAELEDWEANEPSAKKLKT